MKPDDFPNHPGTYILLLHMEHSAQLTIARLGRVDCAAGWYVYVGSAFGPGGLRGRLKHHLTPRRSAHWHIDYLREAATVRTVCWQASERIFEHRLAATLAACPDAMIPIPRFGASDCMCVSHLVFFAKRPACDTLYISLINNDSQDRSTSAAKCFGV